MSEKQSEENAKTIKEPEPAESGETGVGGTELSGTGAGAETGVSDRSDGEKLNKAEDELENQEKVEQVVARVIENRFSGPIPPPNVIAGYESIVPGAAERIIKMAEIQSAHRQEMESIIIRAESRDSLLGVLFAFGMGIGCIVACIVMVITVQESASVICGSLLGATGIASIITSFLKNTRRRNDENEED